MGGTPRPGATAHLGDTSGHVTEVYGEEATAGGRATATQGGDKGGVAPDRDVLVEGTPGPGATTHPGDISDHITAIYRGATTTVGRVTVSPGGDKAVVAPGGDVLEEGAEEPCVTEDPGDALGHADAVPGGDVTTAARVTATQGGDKVGVAPDRDVLVEGTTGPGATTHLGDTSDHVTVVYREEATAGGRATAPQGGDKVGVAPDRDILMEGTTGPSATTHPGDISSHVTEVYRGATATVGRVTASPGGDKVTAALAGDVLEEGTEEPCVTDVPGDTLGHDTVGRGGDVTTAARVTASQGGDREVVARGGDVLMEGTERPSATTHTGDTSDHVTEVYRAEATAAGRVTASQGGDEVVVGHDRDVLMEGTPGPGATNQPRDISDGVKAVYREEATTMGSVTASQGGDKVTMAPGGDVLEEGAEEPCVTEDPGDALSHADAVPGGDVTTAARVTASRGGDREVATGGGDVLMEGTERPSATTHTGDTSDYVTVVYGEETTAVGRVTMSQGGDKVGVAPDRDVLMEGTGQPSATTHPGDISDHVTEVYRGATTTVGRVTVSQGGDKAVVAPGGDVLEEGTEEPCVTEDPGDALGHADAVQAESATMVGRVTASQGGDRGVVGHGRDVLMEGTPGPSATNQPGVTSDHVTVVYREEATAGGRATMSQGGDKVGVAPDRDVLMEGTGQPSATTHPGDISDHVTEVYRGATTTVGRVTVSPGGDKAVVAPGGDVLEEGTEEPCVTEDPGDALGHADAVQAESATMVGRVTASQGGDRGVVGHGRDVLMEGTPGPGATNQPGVTSDHITVVYREEATMEGRATMSQGGDKVGVGHDRDVLMEGTTRPGATTHPGDISSHVTEVYRGATTMVGRVTVSPGGDKAVVAPGGDVLEEGTEEPCVTEDPGDTLGHADVVRGGEATTAGRVTASRGGDKAAVSPGGDVLTGGTGQPGATTPPGDTPGHATASQRGATTAAGGRVPVSPGGDKATGVTGGVPARRPPPRCRPRGPPAPAGAFPVTVGPPRTPSPQASSGAFGLAPPPLLLLLLLPLVLR